MFAATTSRRVLAAGRCWGQATQSTTRAPCVWLSSDAVPKFSGLSSSRRMEAATAAAAAEASSKEAQAASEKSSKVYDIPAEMLDHDVGAYEATASGERETRRFRYEQELYHDMIHGLYPDAVENDEYDMTQYMAQFRAPGRPVSTPKIVQDTLQLMRLHEGRKFLDNELKVIRRNADRVCLELPTVEIPASVKEADANLEGELQMLSDELLKIPHYKRDQKEGVINVFQEAMKHLDQELQKEKRK